MTLGPKVGILIPTCRRSEFLCSSLASAVGQTYSNLQIIVIDNCPDEWTSQILKEVGDPRVSYIPNDADLRLTGSVNKGVELFDLDVTWCTVLCDDDLLAPSFIEEMVVEITAGNVQAVIHGAKTLIDEKGMTLSASSHAPQSESSLEYIAARARFERQTFLSGVVFSREAFLYIGGYPVFTTGTSTDDAFIFALALGGPLRYCDRALTFIRLHAETESADGSAAINHIHSSRDFRNYIAKVSRESGLFGAGELAQIESLMCDYARKNNGHYWHAYARHVSGLFGKVSGIESEKLLAVIDNPVYQFPVRVRVAALFLRCFSLYLEKVRMYRAVWLLVDLCSRLSKSSRSGGLN